MTTLRTIARAIHKPWRVVTIERDPSSGWPPRTAWTVEVRTNDERVTVISEQPEAILEKVTR